MVAIELETPSQTGGDWSRRDVIAVAVAPGTGVTTMRFYGRRWLIETMFHKWALDRNKPRPKTIHAHVVQFAAFALFKTLSEFAGFVSALLKMQGFTGSSLDRLVSSIERGRWILDPETAPD